MRSQYKVLAEKYNQVKEASLFPEQKPYFEEAYKTILEIVPRIKESYETWVNANENHKEMESTFIRWALNYDLSTKETGIRSFNDYLIKKTEHAIGSSPYYFAGIFFMPISGASANFDNAANIKFKFGRYAPSFEKFKDPNKIYLSIGIGYPLLLELMYPGEVSRIDPLTPRVRPGFGKNLSILRKELRPASVELAEETLKEALYHEFIHYEQLIRMNPEYIKNVVNGKIHYPGVTKLLGKPAPGVKLFSRPHYFNSKQEIMTWAYHTAKDIVQLYGSAEALNKFNEYINREDVNRYMDERKYTSENKKTFYKNTVAYINQIITGKDEKALKKPESI